MWSTAPVTGDKTMSRRWRRSPSPVGGLRIWIPAASARVVSGSVLAWFHPDHVRDNDGRATFS
jgi:hypothetical protein